MASMTPDDLRRDLRAALDAKAAAGLFRVISRFRVSGKRVEFTRKDHPTHPGLLTLDDDGRRQWKQAVERLRGAAKALESVAPHDALVATMKHRADSIEREAEARRRTPGRRRNVEDWALVATVATECLKHGIRFTDTGRISAPATKVLSVAFEFHGQYRAEASLRPYLRLGRDIQIAMSAGGPER